MMAGAAISMLPGLVLTVLMHRYIFKGIAIGSGFGGRERRIFAPGVRVPLTIRGYLGALSMSRG